ncbi:MAG: UDP-N-acetylglucosamine 2-epimerase [Bdellovibrionota bacterium]
MNTEAKKSICVVTGSRADYGLLRWTLAELANDPFFELQLVVTGSHLRAEFGNTVEIIERDKFPIAERFDILSEDNSPQGMARSLGKAVLGFTDAFTRLSPDLVLLLGDRYEMLAAGETALLLRLPIAHIHGGERTEGAVDEAVRHSLTKMAHLHFVSTEEYRKRVIQLGEPPSSVHFVGALTLDCIAHANLFDPDSLRSKLNFAWTDPLLLITLHSETLGNETSDAACDALFDALNRIGPHSALFTASNADAGGIRINERIMEYVQHRSHARLIQSLGNELYLGVMHASAAVVGNSSSGIFEAPLLGVPSVNIGDRQRGRLRSNSILDCPFRPQAIAEAINRALSSDFSKAAKERRTPYGEGSPAKKIVEILRNTDLSRLHMKEFYDLPHR